jgi:hypothetical protein
MNLPASLAASAAALLISGSMPGSGAAQAKMTGGAWLLAAISPPRYAASRRSAC